MLSQSSSQSHAGKKSGSTLFRANARGGGVVRQHHVNNRRLVRIGPHFKGFLSRAYPQRFDAVVAQHFCELAGVERIILYYQKRHAF